MDVDIYHDESKEAGYWHDILVVPRGSRAALLTKLDQARRNAAFGAPLGVKGMKSGKGGKGGKLNCLRAFISIGVASMIRKKTEIYYTAKRCYVAGQGMRRDYATTDR